MDPILPYIWLVIGCGWRQTVCFKKMWPNSRGYSEILTTVWRLNFVFKIKSSIRIYKALPVWHWWLGLFHYFNRILFNTAIQTNAYSYFKESAPIPQVFFFFFRSSSKPSMGRWYVICWEQLALNRKKQQQQQPIHLSWFSHPGKNYCSPFLYSLREQPTFSDAITGFAAKWRLRNERRNSILMTHHYPDLGSAFDWSCR